MISVTDLGQKAPWQIQRTEKRKCPRAEWTRKRISRDKVREVIEVQITNDKLDFDSVCQEALIVEWGIHSKGGRKW